ncbi:MAG: Holliday junction branch migration DNA helicase RuvB [bacterium]|nr:Holliday junction branch migration DNA helicase RuvB [bacterium]
MPVNTHEEKVNPGPTNPLPQELDKALEPSLRPKSLNEYVGQEKLKRNLEISIDAARRRNQAIEHVLLYGPAGLGKTTLAHIIAAEVGANIKATSGPAIEKVGDLASILTNLETGDVLFIDEVHRLPKTIEEVLYPAMEDYRIDILIGKGPTARTLALELPRFTLIAATTRIGLLSSPLRSRFGMTFRLDYYLDEDIKKILHRSAAILGVTPHDRAVSLIAASSRFTPRVANRLLKRIRDFADVKGDGTVTEQLARDALAMMEVDLKGLEETDRMLLRAVIEKFGGGPVGLKTLAVAIGEEEDTLEDIYEPYLMQLGFLARTPRGRVATPMAYGHLGLEVPKTQGLF